MASSCNGFVTNQPVTPGFLKNNFGAQERCQLRKKSELNSLPKVWEAYNTALETDPLITKSITAGVILGAADCAGQLLENKSKNDIDEKEFDLARAVRFARTRQEPGHGHRQVLLHQGLGTRGRPRRQSC